MPHPTPYSMEFEAIRQAFPGIFDRRGAELPPANADSNDATNKVHTVSPIDFYARRNGRSDAD